MDEKKTRQLLDAFSNMKKDRQQWIERQEKKAWKEVEVTITLEELIGNLTKDEMDDIRKELDIRGISSMKKAELAHELARIIPLVYF